MKKLLIIGLAIFSSCQNKQEENSLKSLTLDSAQALNIVSDSLLIDSVSLKMSTLLQSTEHADKKVSEIKAIKNENKALKQELVETKAELQEAKAALIDTVVEPTKKKKKSFIQKVISTIKKDTVQ